MRRDIRGTFTVAALVQRDVNDGQPRRLPVALRPRGPLIPLLLGVANQNYLRGVQVTDSAGLVTFKDLPPALGSLAPHPLEVYPSLAKATSATNKVLTSQMALPAATNDAVYATTAISSSRTNASLVSLASTTYSATDTRTRWRR